MAIMIGDIHGNADKVRAFLAYKPDQEHVAIGDYLDSFVEPFERQLECLHLLMNSDAVLLLGNHDVHYLQYPLFQFSGYQHENAAKFQDILEGNLSRFKVAHAVDGWLCTHAGVSSQLAEETSDVAALADLFNNRWEHYLANRSAQDKSDYEYKSLFTFNYFCYVEGNLLAENVRQIFGHMELKTPDVTDTYIALDTTNSGDNSYWLYDTEAGQLVELCNSEVK